MSDAISSAIRVRREAEARAEQRYGYLPDGELGARAALARRRLEDLRGEARLLDQRLERARREAEDLNNLAFKRGL